MPAVGASQGWVGSAEREDWVEKGPLRQSGPGYVFEIDALQFLESSLGHTAAARQILLDFPPQTS